MKLFVVDMLRWGDEDTHHYVIGVFDNMEDAIKAGDDERVFRGGKYDPKYTELTLNVSRNRLAANRREERG